MNSQRKLTEGLRAGDLSGLVLPLISVDEYESKINDDAVVFGFYVQDRDAAADLNRFIQKSPISIIDTDMSPAPDQHGYFLVFIEMLNNDRIAENLKVILDEIEPLVEIDEWQMRIRKTSDLIDFSEEELLKGIKRARRTDENITNFLFPSILETLQIKDDVLKIGRAGISLEFNILGFGDLNLLMVQNKLLESSIDLGISNFVRCKRIANMLGEGWIVSKLNNCFILEHEYSDEALLLEEKN